MSKLIHIFKISNGYNRCRVYNGSSRHKHLIGTSTITVDSDKGLTRRQRYDVIAEWLNERCGIPAPPYVPTKSEERRSVREQL